MALTNKKISELPEYTHPGYGDLVEISTDNGDGTFTSQRVSYGELRDSILASINIEMRTGGVDAIGSDDVDITFDSPLPGDDYVVAFFGAEAFASGQNADGFHVQRITGNQNFSYVVILISA